MSIVLPQEFLDFVLCNEKLSARHADCADHKNDFYRRIGLREDSIECVKGENLVSMVVLEQGKVLGFESGYRVARLVCHYDIKLEEAFGVRRRRSCVIGSRSPIRLSADLFEAKKESQAYEQR
jgi:hypothetical protein